MKLPIIGGIAFIASLGGATVVGMMTAKPEATEIESVGDTSEVVDSNTPAVVDSQEVAAEPIAGDSVVDVPPAATPQPVVVPGPPVVRPPVPQRTPRATSNESAKKLARIFSAMQPTDAAAVLSRLSDGDVIRIITQLGTRQAAAIISSLSEQRAARLSRILLRQKLETGGGS